VYATIYPNIIKVNKSRSEMGRSCNMHRRIRRTCKRLLGKPYRKRNFEKLRHRWKGNIKMDVRVRMLT
jgi:hypothetical protein